MREQVHKIGRQATETDWVTLGRAATIAGVGRMTLHRATQRGEIAHATLLGIRYFHVSDIENWVAPRPHA